VVRAVVDTSSGPSRGQTVCDMRGAYAGYPEVAGAGCRVVLSLEEDFAPHLVETLLTLHPVVELVGG
jgi:purine nucleosidase